MKIWWFYYSFRTHCLKDARLYCFILPFTCCGRCLCSSSWQYYNVNYICCSKRNEVIIWSPCEDNLERFNMLSNERLSFCLIKNSGVLNVNCHFINLQSPINQSTIQLLQTTLLLYIYSQLTVLYLILATTLYISKFFHLLLRPKIQFNDTISINKTPPPRLINNRSCQ